MKEKKVEKKFEDRELVKFCYKANCWCKTIFKDGKQGQEFYSDKDCKIKI